MLEKRMAVRPLHLEGELVVRDGRNGPVAARIPVTPSEDWQIHTASLAIEKGKRALYFTFE